MTENERTKAKKPFPYPKHISLSLVQIFLKFLSFRSLKLQFINAVLLDLISSDMIHIRKQKYIQVAYIKAWERMLFLGSNQVLTFCIKFARHRLPVWNLRCSCYGLPLLQEDKHPLHILISINEPQMHSLPIQSKASIHSELP